MSPALSIEGTNCKAILIFLRQSPLRLPGTTGLGLRPSLVCSDCRCRPRPVAIESTDCKPTFIFCDKALFVQLTVRQIKYLNNIVEQDHRFIKKITKPMKGFKAFSSAHATLAGIELHHMLRKKQHTQSANQTIFEQFYGLAA